MLYLINEDGTSENLHGENKLKSLPLTILKNQFKLQHSHKYKKNTMEILEDSIKNFS
jgi:hypothetical protein